MKKIDGLERVRRLRTRLKQYDLASELGISQTRLSGIECAGLQPSPALLERNLGVLEGELRDKSK